MTSTLPPREAQEYFGILVWTFATLMHPEYILESPVEVTCFEFNSAQPSLVVGGCCNGQIIMWDNSRVSLGALMSVLQISGVQIRYGCRSGSKDVVTYSSDHSAFTSLYCTCGAPRFCMAQSNHREQARSRFKRCLGRAGGGCWGSWGEFSPSQSAQ